MPCQIPNKISLCFHLLWSPLCDFALFLCLPPLPTILPFSAQSPLSLLLYLRLSIQVTQISLPPNRNKTRKNAPVLRIYKRKTERCNRRPQFTTIYHTYWYSSFYSFPDFVEGIAREEGLHAEEVRVEDGGEAYLVYGD